VSIANQLPATITVEEFLDWNPPGSDRWELIDGTPTAMAPAAPRHGAIQNEVGRLIGNHLAESHPGCRVVIEPGIQPRVRANVNARVPDLAVTCSALEPSDKLLREPIIVIEILSPSNKADTWANVGSYVTIPEVREIVLLYTAEVRADLLRRDDDGVWPEDPLVLRSDAPLTLETIGFIAPVATFYRTA
jgi:Uma2 family endonuclease